MIGLDWIDDWIDDWIGLMIELMIELMIGLMFGLMFGLDWIGLEAHQPRRELHQLGTVARRRHTNANRLVRQHRLSVRGDTVHRRLELYGQGHHRFISAVAIAVHR